MTNPTIQQKYYKMGNNAQCATVVVFPVAERAEAAALMPGPFFRAPPTPLFMPQAAGFGLFTA